MESNNENLNEESLQIEIDGKKGFAVSPKTNCPHCLDSFVENLDSAIVSLRTTLLTSPCKICADSSENWFCLSCENVFCSRYVQGHMSSHNAEMKHPIAFSLSDGSFWCYECNSYIINNQLSYVQSKFSFMKFPDED